MAPEPHADVRRVLMIAYFFPPLGGVGVQRALKFAKYLPENGWLPTVLTTRSRVYPKIDPTLSRELPASTRVVRARQPRGAMGPAVALSKLGLDQASRMASFPDPAIAWIPDAVRLALRTVREERPAVIFSTSAPPSAHLIALAVHKRTGIPWVADFRDEWAANPYSQDPALLRRAARRLEALITSNASVVTVVGEYFDICNPAGATVAVIPNGVDDADCVEFDRPRNPEERLCLSYVGSLYGEQDAAPVFAALERLGRRGAIDHARMRVRIVGSDWRTGDRRWPVAVEHAGHVPHREALREMRSASMLLHYTGPSTMAAGGKIYEYLASGRPVLCVAPQNGNAATLVRDAGAGPIASPDDPGAIEDAILDLYNRWQTTGLPDQPRVRDWVLARYSRRRLTSELATILDRAVAGGFAGSFRRLPHGWSGATDIE